jgi:hypothetical protein
MAGSEHLVLKPGLSPKRSPLAEVKAVQRLGTTCGVPPKPANRTNPLRLDFRFVFAYHPGLSR